MIVLTVEAFSKLSPPTRAEILAQYALSSRPAVPPKLLEVQKDEKDVTTTDMYKDIDMEGVADLDYHQIVTWMEAAQDKTKAGLRVFAEHGPIIDFHLLHDAGVDNIPHFQSRTTIRTRTVLKDKTKTLFMLGYDEWIWDHEKNEYSSGRYAVTKTTFDSLRRYFKIE